MGDTEEDGEVASPAATAGSGGAAGDRQDAAASALADALTDAEGTPTCEVCPATADFYLFEAGRVSKFVCWEHVSPVAAAVDETPADADRPVAVRLE